MARKLSIAAVAVVLAVFLAPIAWSARGTHGYFDDGRCICGHPVFIRLDGDGYFKYSPGHGVPEHRAFALRARGGEWEVLALPSPEGFWSPSEEGKVVARLRLQDGALYESWSGATKWTRYARVYNIWRIWIARLLSE